MSSIRCATCPSFGLLILCVLALAPARADEFSYTDEYPSTIDARWNVYGDEGGVFISDGNSCASCGESNCGIGDCETSDGGDECSKCCGLGRGCRCQCASQQESWYNCGCNGSYKFPVPPLYTYMWPGLYSQQLVTDYHSPWRFPPLKPYTNESPTGEPFESASLRRSTVRRVSAQSPVAGSVKSASNQSQEPRLETTSERIRRLYNVR